MRVWDEKLRQTLEYFMTPSVNSLTIEVCLQKHPDLGITLQLFTTFSTVPKNPNLYLRVSAYSVKGTICVFLFVV